MNQFQRRLWQNLSELVEKNEAFFYKDFVRDGKQYRIFNYRLASYTDFCEPDALECRGVMFEIVGNNRAAEATRLVSLPPEKFFNYQENPFTMEVDFSDIVSVMDKADGSLISTYNHNGKVATKSKGSLESDQAYAAEKLLYSDPLLLSMIERLVLDVGLTVNMEYVAPDNRIVMAYSKPQLIILNVRDNENGNYVDLDTARSVEGCYDITQYWVDEYNIYDEFDVTTPDEFVENVRHMTGREGFVIRLQDQQLKLKTEWYLTQHRAKDSINSPRRLFEAVLEEATDDLRSLFHDQPEIIEIIAEMEQRVEHIYNPLVDKIERFYERNKDLERKEYAILGQQTFTQKGEFGLAMNKYLGKDTDYKMFLRKHYKDYGIADDPINEDGDE